MNRICQEAKKFCVAASLAIIVLAAGATPSLRAQTGQDTNAVEPITADSWTAGTAMPVALLSSTAAVLGNSIYLIGGQNAKNTIVPNVYLYNPAIKTWSKGVPYPTAVSFASAAAVNNVLYAFGGTADGMNPTSAVWAYSAKTKKWTAKAAMPTARWGTAAVVKKSIIYVIGGSLDASGEGDLNTVESYNPATDSWSVEAELPVAASEVAAALYASTIIVADGGTNGGGQTGDTEGYNAMSNAWVPVAGDPVSRYGSCFGEIGSKLYDAGGANAPDVTESFQFSKNQWESLAAIPQTTIYPASAVYKEQLYCFGGWASWQGVPIDNVQIYQP